jgi:3-carboxy-cis,cis-muconate cycloisomerase
MLDAEAALAGAQGDVGDIPAEAATAIATACRAEHFDVALVLEAATLGGNPVIPLVPLLRELVGADAAEFVHRGATSQDIVDAATVLIIRRCSGIVMHRLLDAERQAATLDARYGATPMIARTLGQYAVPTTFGTVTQRWIDALGESSRALASPAAALTLGGPSGDGASFGEHRARIGTRFAERLGVPWYQTARHTQRTTTAAVAGAWGLAASATAKVALDVVLLAQSDVGELAEVAEGAGGSSSMVHKRNPIAAICARAAAMQAPGLTATLLQAAGSHELERAAGAWHAEWPALNQLLRATGSAVEWLNRSLERLVVDTDRMAANLQRSREEGDG